MNDHDAIQIIHKLDEALNILRRYDGQLSAEGIRTKTIISIARSEIAQAFSDSCHDQQHGTELFQRPMSTPPFPAGPAHPLAGEAS
jgi:hypothetical protein